MDAVKIIEARIRRLEACLKDSIADGGRYGLVAAALARRIDEAQEIVGLLKSASAGDK